MSGVAKDLLRKMLVVDPTKRMTLTQIRKHPFCRAHQQPITKGLLPGQKIYVDCDIVEEMKKIKYAGFIKDIEENAIN